MTSPSRSKSSKSQRARPPNGPCPSVDPWPCPSVITSAALGGLVRRLSHSVHGAVTISAMAL
jgi:hypothetical protein